jgi:N-acetylglucosaminyldiphosphoundecaprenol N-acetyl-beta-D-mannosaminyltransferase
MVAGAFVTAASTPLTRLDVLGLNISLVDHAQVQAEIARTGRTTALQIAVCNVHSLMSARSQPELAAAINEADIATPDGVPLTWALRLLYGVRQPRVAGPDILDLALVSGSGERHFFYGSTEETLAKIRSRIAEEYPNVLVAGTLSPPFSPLSDDDLRQHVRRIESVAADVVWVGLGMPKQELWIQRAAPLLPGAALVGVGAAFDFFAGNTRRAPGWAQRAGFEWFFRFVQEPRRTWRRYFSNNPRFVVLLLVTALRQWFSESGRPKRHSDPA